MSLFGGSGGGAGSGGNTPMYQPTGLGAADTSWQNMFNAQSGIASNAQSQTSPYFQQSLQQGENINYQPYLQGAQQAGNLYGQVGQAAQGQMAGYGQQAQQALGQQGAMYLSLIHI